METHAAERFEGLFDGRGTRPARVVVGGLLFLLVFGAASLLVRETLARVPGLRLEEEGMAAIKGRHLEEHGDEYDLVFVGSSRVYRQLKPVLFDAECAARGVEVHSYNLGLAGMRFYEALWTAQRLLERRPARLRALVIEALHPYPVFRVENRTSRREIAWHTPGLTVLALRRVWSGTRPLAEKLEETRGHLGQFGAALTSVGVGPALEDRLFGRVRAGEDATPGGFLPLELDPAESVIERRREFLETLNANRDLLGERVRELQAQPKREPPDDLLRATLRDLQDEAARAGVVVIFLELPPAETLRPEYASAAEEGTIEHFLSYADPDRYPQFYRRLADRFDLNHLKKAGASKLTKLVAEGVASILAAEGGD